MVFARRVSPSVGAATPRDRRNLQLVSSSRWPREAFIVAACAHQEKSNAGAGTTRARRLRQVVCSNRLLLAESTRAACGQEVKRYAGGATPKAKVAHPKERLAQYLQVGCILALCGHLAKLFVGERGLTAEPRHPRASSIPLQPAAYTAAAHGPQVRSNAGAAMLRANLPRRRARSSLPVREADKTALGIKPPTIQVNVAGKLPQPSDDISSVPGIVFYCFGGCACPEVKTGMVTGAHCRLFVA